MRWGLTHACFLTVPWRVFLQPVLVPLFWLWLKLPLHGYSQLLVVSCPTLRRLQWSFNDVLSCCQVFECWMEALRETSKNYLTLDLCLTWYWVSSFCLIQQLLWLQNSWAQVCKNLHLFVLERGIQLVGAGCHRDIIEPWLQGARHDVLKSTQFSNLEKEGSGAGWTHAFSFE